ncbi:MAG TPA: hypothetical protein VHD37_02355 [Candidatus Paceibacterota bacterium]|nr:hypothetical protein [Candidatus Paceibacterota bacterium]
MNIVSRAVRSNFSASQASQETAARIAAAEAGKNFSRNSASSKEQLRRRIAAAKKFKPVSGQKRPKVVVGGKEYPVARICENTGTVYLAGKKGRHVPYSPEVLELV